MTSSADPATPSYYDRLGGAPTITVAVDQFYQRVLDDPELAHFFTDADLPQLKRHQVMLFSQILGGPKAYEGRELAAAHAGLNINDAQFDKVGKHLLSVLDDLGAPGDIAEAVADVLGSVKPDIVGNGSGI